MSEEILDKSHNDFVVEELGASSNAQLALSLFEELVPKELKISDAPTEVGYNRANVFLDLLDLSLLGRRAIDVAYFIVAQCGLNNKYFSRYPKEDYVTYVVDLEFFKWLMGYASNNRTHLRSVLRQGQKAAIEIEMVETSLFEHENKNSHLESSKEEEAASNKKGHLENKNAKGSKSNLDQWMSVPLLGPVGFNKGQVYFQVHKELEPYIKNPSTFHFLDLRYIFETLRGRILYDRVQPYVHAGVTPWFSVQELRKTLDCASKLYQEYKYFTSRALNKAVEDINKNSDLSISYQELLEEGSSRKVASIRFLIQRTERLTSAREHLDKLSERYDTLVEEFGLNKAQIQEISKNRQEWTEERLNQAIEYTRHRIKYGKTKILNTASYFMTALKEHYVVGTAMKEIEQEYEKEQSSPKKAAKKSAAKGADKPPKAAKPAALFDDETYKQRSEAGVRKFSQLASEVQTELFEQFLKSPVARVAAAGDQLKVKDVTLEIALSAPLLRLEFGAFAFKKIEAMSAKA